MCQNDCCIGRLAALVVDEAHCVRKVQAIVYRYHDILIYTGEVNLEENYHVWGS